LPLVELDLHADLVDGTRGDWWEELSGLSNPQQSVGSCPRTTTTGSFWSRGREREMVEEARGDRRNSVGGGRQAAAVESRGARRAERAKL
jgi:hypothetical protein